MDFVEFDADGDNLVVLERAGGRLPGGFFDNEFDGFEAFALRPLFPDEENDTRETDTALLWNAPEYNSRRQSEQSVFRKPAAFFPTGGSIMADQPAQPPKFLDQVRGAIRLRRMSYRTEQAYVDWAKRFIIFHDKPHPKEMGAPEIKAFIAYLVNQRNVSASTQNQALHARILIAPRFLYRVEQVADAPPIKAATPLSNWEQLPIVLAGRAGGALQTGRILNCLDKGNDNRRACSLYLSLMDIMGVQLDRFGDTD